MFSFSKDGTTIVLGKAFSTSDLESLVHAMAQGMVSTKALVVDHPPTPALAELLTALSKRYEVAYRDHHLSDRTVYPEMPSGISSVIVTREEHPSCSTLVNAGEFAGQSILGDEDMDGFLSAAKAAGWDYPALDSDAAVLDGPVSGMVREGLSTTGFLFMKAWKGLPGFQDTDRKDAMSKLVSAYLSAVMDNDYRQLIQLSKSFDQKVEATKALVEAKAVVDGKIRMISITSSDKFEPVTLAQLMDEGVSVSGRVVSTGPIARIYNDQVSLARTKLGESRIDFQALAEKAFGPKTEAWGPEFGVISNTPFLIHMSPERWEAFKPVLTAALS